MQKNLLITGKPRSGKSTLLKKLIADIPNKVGFVTNEVLGEHGRVGFEIETHTGYKAVLAHVDFKTQYPVSKYFVNIENLESVLPAVASFERNSLLYVDEIGQMQLFSEKFRELVLQYLDSPNTCLATLSYIFEDDFTKSIKAREDILIVEISSDDREEKEGFIRQLLKKIEKAKGYIAEPERFVVKGSEVELQSAHGTRSLTRADGKWNCTCNFFSQNGVCSHTIAIMEIAKGEPKRFQ